MFVASLTSYQHDSVSQEPVCLDSCTCCHAETEVTAQTFYLTQSQYTDTGPVSPSADPMTPDVATLRQKLQINLSIPPSHSILTPGQPTTTDPLTPGAWQGSH